MIIDIEKLIQIKKVKFTKLKKQKSKPKDDEDFITIEVERTSEHAHENKKKIQIRSENLNILADQVKATSGSVKNFCDAARSRGNQLTEDQVRKVFSEYHIIEMVSTC